MHLHHTNQIISMLIAELFENVYEKIQQKKTQKKLSKFVLNHLIKSRNEIQKIGLVKNQEIHIKQKISKILDKTNIKNDNFSIGKCKSFYLKIQSHSKSNTKITKSLSSRSQYLINTHREQESTNITSSRLINRKFHPKQSPYIKIDNQTKQQIQQSERQQNLRNQLQERKQILQNKLKSASQANKKLNQRKKRVQSKLRELKNFTFHYDSTMLKSKQNRITKYTQKQQNSKDLPSKEFQEIIQLKQNVSRTINMVKRINLQAIFSTPQLIENPASHTKQQNQKTIQKPKSYRQQIVFNQKRSHSLIEQIKAQSKIQKGVIFKESFNGKTQRLKKDSIPISKSLLDLNKNQFHKEYQHKKFIKRITKN